MPFFARAQWGGFRPRGRHSPLVQRCRRLLAGCGLLILCAVAAPAQVLSPPPQLAPTVAALNALHECSKNAAGKAGGIAADIDNAQQSNTS